MFTFILLLNSWFVTSQPAKLSAEVPMNHGEVLEFRLSYGWFKVGSAKWITYEKRYEGEECYQFKVTAESSGLLGVFARVDDEWGEYMRKRDYLPLMAYRDLVEGKYVLDEKTYFDYDNQKIRYERIRKGERKPTEYIDMDQPRLGMLGGFMQMRCVDYSQYKKWDRIKINAFFEGEPYEFELLYAGIEEIDSPVGKLRAHKLVPDLPENRLFPGEYPVKVWLSADKNRLPLRADAKLYLGSAYVELVNYKNIKFGPDYRD
jgi:hypothetical protein